MRRSMQFIEFIAGEFAKCEASLDLLETKVRKGLRDASISSLEILDVAVPAGRAANRAMRAISEVPAVQKDLVKETKVGELDEIWTMADEDAFGSETRSLHLRTALKIILRVSANLATSKQELIHTHL